MNERRCDDCGQPTGLKFARYCDAHRWRHRGKRGIHKLTPERAAYMREHYRPSERGTSLNCATVLGVPKWRVCRWAAELGLTGQTNKGPDWTAADEAFLEQHIGTRHPNWIAKKLGRSVTAVIVKSKRLSISRRGARTWYTASQVAEGFGVDPSTAMRWIERGWLPAKHEGQDYPNGKAAAWRVEHAAVRRFVQQHPNAYTLAKVNQAWFLDVVFDGAIGSQERVA